jgi:polar amino acid transport system substrate-binding protein
MAADAEILAIGHDAAFEPFAMVENGRPTGMILEIVAAALARAGLRWEFVALSLDEAEAAVVGGRVAALAFKGVTPARRAVLDFSQPIVVSGAALFAPAGGPPFRSLEDLVGRTVATPRAGPLAAEIARAAPGVTVLPSTSYPESLALVLAGKADAAALNWHAGLRMARAKHPGRFALPAAPYVSVPLAFAVAKGARAALLGAVDAEMAAMRADGTFAAIERRWLGR